MCLHYFLDHPRIPEFSLYFEQRHNKTVLLGRPEGDKGSPPLLQNHQNIEFLSNTGPDPLKIHKATKPAFDSSLGHHRHVPLAGR